MCTRTPLPAHPTSDRHATIAQALERVSPLVWTTSRWCGVGGALGIVAAGIVAPHLALTLFWDIFVPLLPVLFLVAPGLWRNVCPMAALNQLPRRLAFTRGWKVPAPVQRVSPLISAGLFLLVVSLRKTMLDSNGFALTVFLLAVLILAFIGGVLFKGKSGWCTQFCPLLQVERFYGQSPLLVVRHGHCQPCVGCMKNCHDVRPMTAYLADLYDPGSRLAMLRKLFAGAMPWLIVAFFTQPALTHITMMNVAALYGRIGLFVATGIVTFMCIEATTALTAQQVVLVHAVAALNLFYWFVVPVTLRGFGLHATLPAYLIQGGVAIVSLIWLRQVRARERIYLSDTRRSSHSHHYHPCGTDQTSQGCHTRGGPG